MLDQNFGALRKNVPTEPLCKSDEQTKTCFLCHDAANGLTWKVKLKHNSKGWYIEYYKLNPIVNEFEKIRIMLNRERKRCKTLTEFKLQARAIMLQIDNQLAAGYINVQQNLSAYGFGTPDTTVGDNVRYYTPIEEVLALFIEDKKNELSDSTMRTYSAFCSQFKKWLHTNYPTMTTSMFTQVQANQYMEFVQGANNSKGKKLVRHTLKEGRVSPRTYNNYIKLGRAFFTWAIEKSYARVNPFEKLKMKKAQGKDRTIIPKEDRDKIVAYFREHNPAFIIIMQMVYKSFLRPIEISRVKVNQINFEEHCIEMHCDQTKNGK